MNLSRIFKFALIGSVTMALGLLLTGCDKLPFFGKSEEVAPTSAPVAAEQPAPAVQAPPAEVKDIPAPEPAAASKYYYDPTNKPDPFTPFMIEEKAMNEKEMITRYEVRFFRLVGIVADVRVPKAVFEDPQGNSYVLKVGDVIGKNGGVITAILPTEVHITETRVTILGDTTTNNIVIQLHPEEKLNI